jgi:hypothetical protein
MGLTTILRLATLLKAEGQTFQHIQIYNKSLNNEVERNHQKSTNLSKVYCR